MRCLAAYRLRDELAVTANTGVVDEHVDGAHRLYRATDDERAAGIPPGVEALRSIGLQVSQLTVLVATAMFGEGGVKIGVMADVLGMERTTLTRNLRPMEKEGWLRVARDPADARARIVLLTRAGERTIEKAFPLWEQSQKRLRALLGKGQADDLRKNLMAVSSKFAERGVSSS